MAATNNFSFYRGEAIQLTLTMSPVVDVAGQTFTFIMAGLHRTVTLTKTPATLVAPTANGQFTFLLSHADTLTLTVGTYEHEVWRVDSGAEAKLSVGSIDVLPELLYP